MGLFHNTIQLINHYLNQKQMETAQTQQIESILVLTQRLVLERKQTCVAFLVYSLLSHIP